MFKEGSVSQAVRASISIPGVFVPHEMGGRQLVDGAVVDRIPVSVLKEMGADLIIASDVSRVKNRKGDEIIGCDYAKFGHPSK